MPPFSPTRYLSHLFLVISVGVFLFSKIVPGMREYAMSRFFLGQGDWLSLIVQFFLYQFLHGDIFHLLLNGFFLYQLGPEIESRLRRGSEFQIFFLINTLFVGIALLLLASGPTLGISGWCMAMLAYLALDLRATRHPMAQSVTIMLVINILMGFIGNISLVGHAAGAICGALFWYWRNRR